MVDLVPVPPALSPPALTVARIHEYVWARYVQFQPAPFELDEDEALAVLERHYQANPIDADAECFYFGILAYERSFASEAPRVRRNHLRRALAAFQAYRKQTTEGFTWEPVDDRYAHLVEQLWPALEAAAGAVLD